MLCQQTASVVLARTDTHLADIYTYISSALCVCVGSVDLLDAPTEYCSELLDCLLYCIVLYCYCYCYCIVLYCIVLYCIVLYCIVLYCIVLYCIVIVFYCIVL